MKAAQQRKRRKVHDEEETLHLLGNRRAVHGGGKCKGLHFRFVEELEQNENI